MSQRLEDRIKELCAKAVVTPESPELNAILKQLHAALLDCFRAADLSDTRRRPSRSTQPEGWMKSKIPLGRKDSMGLPSAPACRRQGRLRFLEVLNVE